MRSLRTQRKTFLILFVVVLGLVALAALSSRAGMPVAAPARATTTPTLRPQESLNLAEARVRVQRAYGKLPLSFEENRGQTESSVRFLSRGEGYVVFVKSTETILTLRQPSPDTRRLLENAGDRTMDAHGARSTPPTVLTMTLVGANPAPPSAGLEKLPGKVNYFIGNDPARWQKDLPTYAKVESRNVYPGVNMVHRGNQRQLEYDFVVAPGADPDDIRLSFSGMQKMHLESGGDLVLTTAAGEIRQQKPYIYQERAGVQRAVAGGYLLKGNNEIGFAVGAYDASLPLVLDPVLAYSTYLGGTLNDEARGIAVDANGNAYVAGVTSSYTSFPRAGDIPGVVGGLDVFVSKLNAAGDTLIYSTFLGHEQSESAEGIAVDDGGHAYITGYTRSRFFPTTPSLYQGINPDTYAVFVTRLNADGNGLVYSTFLGGSTPSTPGAAVLQEGLAIAVDSTGYAYITGWTNATNFPQLGAYQGSNRGQIDAFVTKLDTNASGSASLVYSTYLGGGTTDRGVGIAVDSAGRAYVTGRTDSGGAVPFPTLNAIQGTLAGGVDAFVAKLDTTMSGGSSLVYSTYLGGSGNENLFSPWPGAIAVDSLGNAYVTGGTNSGTSSTIPFPTTANAYQPTTFGLGEQDAFLTKLNPAGNGLVYSTLFGGSGNDVGFGVAVDSAGHAYLSGETGQASNADFPRRSPVQPTFGGGITDAFVAKLDTNASGDASLVYSTFLGGAHADLGFGIALDSAGTAYVTGKTNSAGMATVGAFQPGLGNPAGGAYSDAFVAKIEEPPVIAPSGLRVSSIVGNLVTFRWTPPAIGPAPAGYVVEGGINPGQVLGGAPTGSAPILTVAMVTGAFYVRVHAIDGTARSAASNEIRIFVNMPVPPSAPAGLVALVNGSAVELAWRNTFGGGAPSALILDVSGSLSASVPLGLSETARFPVVPAGSYTFSLRAANAADISGPSNAVALSVPSSCSGAPLPPENFLAYKIGNTAYVVWDPAANGPASTGYVLHVSGVFTLTLPTNQRTLSGAVPPGTYNLSVSATNVCGSSAATPVQTVVIP